MLKWWVQSFLVGIERAVVGLGDDCVTVRRLRAHATKQLSNRSSGRRPSV